MSFAGFKQLENDTNDNLRKRSSTAKHPNLLTRPQFTPPLVFRCLKFAPPIILPFILLKCLQNKPSTTIELKVYPSLLAQPDWERWGRPIQNMLRDILLRRQHLCSNGPMRKTTPKPLKAPWKP